MIDLPEPWMRGPMAGVDPLVTPVLYAFQHAREDLARYTEGLSEEQIWSRPFDLASVGFHVRHIDGSTDRLMSYLQARELTPQQFDELRAENDPAGPGRAELLAALDQTFRDAETVVLGLDPAFLREVREVGRRHLPTTVIGLLTHIAEHTQRHLGQAISAAKLAAALARTTYTG